MSKATPPDKLPASPKGAARKGRVSPQIREGLRLWIEEGFTQKKALQEIGISNAGWFKAMKRQAVQELAEQMKIAYIQKVEASRATLKAAAIEHGHFLMRNAKSEAVQARMVELFAGEGSKAGGNVAVQVNIDRGGYEYVRPGARVVDIVTDQQVSDTAPDGASGSAED